MVGYQPEVTDAPWPVAEPPFGPQAVIRPGRLLVATPELMDPNFRRAVVLLLETGGDGALGVVLDRPADTPVEAVLPGWGALATEPAVVHVGGPVQSSAAVCVARLRDPGRGVPGGTASVRHAPTLVTVNLDGDPAALAPALSGLRVFAGYTGWSAGQLEAEVAAQGWYVVDALPGDPVSRAPRRLWQDVLRRQGPPLSFVAHFPPDPTLN